MSKMARSFNHMADEIQRQMMELIQSAEKKQQFIDNFAHELRKPMTAIHWYAKYLQKATLTEDDRLSAFATSCRKVGGCRRWLINCSSKPILNMIILCGKHKKLTSFFKSSGRHCIERWREKN
nr:hypothetical protein [Fontibacillus panacisegetis]